MGIKEVIILLLTTVSGFAVSYFKTKANLKEKVVGLILKAEEQFKEYSKAGSLKFNFVVENIYRFVPVVLKGIITKDVISKIVQNTFNVMQSYAQEQLDKQIDSKLKKLDNQ